MAAIRQPSGEHRRAIEDSLRWRDFEHRSDDGCVPIFEECRYIMVYRDGRDALMSWAYHCGAMRSEAVEWLNAGAAKEGLRLLPSWSGDMDELFDQWLDDCSPVRHLASWWPLRHESFSYFVHDNDLQADLEGEMRRLAAFLGIEVPADLWPDAVGRCGLAEMREDARGDGWTDLVFENGADSFFYKGTNARWRGVLTPAQLARYDALVTEQLPADAARWLEAGSLATGVRPHET